MSTALFDLSDFEETRVEWVPLFKPFGLNLASLLVGDRCRDCGTRAPSTTQGSADSIGIYMLCDDCAQVDGCREVRPGRHVSHWGDGHPVEDHDELIEARSTRRQNYLRKNAA